MKSILAHPHARHAQSQQSIWSCWSTVSTFDRASQNTAACQIDATRRCSLSRLMVKCHTRNRRFRLDLENKDDELFLPIIVALKKDLTEIIIISF